MGPPIRLVPDHGLLDEFPYVPRQDVIDPRALVLLPRNSVNEFSLHLLASVVMSIVPLHYPRVEAIREMPRKKTVTVLRVGRALGLYVSVPAAADTPLVVLKV